jgi:MFS family permease
MAFLDARRLTMLIFFLQPIAFGSWLPRIPEIQHSLALGPAGLAIALLGLPCGTLLILSFAGRIVGRIGARRAILIGFPFYTAAVLLPVLAPSPILLFCALLVCGASISFLELGLNVEADQVEKFSGRLLMSTSHGFWSLGIMAGSLVGALLGGRGLAPALSVPLVAVVILPIALIVGTRLPSGTQHEGAVGDGNRPIWPSKALLGICFFVFGVTMTEGAMADWSAIFMRDIMQADTATAGLAYSVFALLVAGGRFAGDWLKARFTAVLVARMCGGLAVIGVVLLYLAPTYPLALAAFGLVGLGVSIGFPIAVSAAASLTDRPAASSVAVLSFIALVGFLVGPPLIGFVSEATDIRFGLAALLPFLLLSLALTGMLMPKAAARSQPAEVAGVA